MASIRTEFHDDERDLMWKVFKALEVILGPKTLKPPKKNTDGKWHFYIESPDHKKKSKALKKMEKE